MTDTTHAPRLRTARRVRGRPHLRREPGPRPLLPGTPWSQSDLLHVLSMLCLSGVGLLVCWIGASGNPYREPELAWTAGGIGAITVAGGAATAWLLTGVRELQARKRQLVRRADAIAAATPQRHAPAVADDARSDLVSAPGMTRYHRPDCLLVRGKALTKRTLAAHTKAGRQPCGVCQP